MNRAFFFATTALFGATAAVPAAAQQIEEIVVTATKREQTLQEVPIAVSVVQEETIADAQIVDINDLQSIVPSLRVSQLERSSNSTFIIRGFGNGANNPGIEPSIGVFVDGVFRTRVGSALNDFMTLDRVEVLKGPQSTLFGKNSSAGVVSIVTKKPEFEWGGAVEATLGNYNQGILKGYLTGPINDYMAFSIAASGNRRDGYFDNVGQDEFGSPVDDQNDRDRSQIRAQLLAQPSDNLEFRLILDRDELVERCCGTVRVTDGPTGPIIRDVLGGQTAASDFSYVVANDNPNINKIENIGASLQMDWDVNSSATFTSITAYREYEDFTNYEGDFTDLELLGDNIRGLDTNTFTQEVRLVGEAGRFGYLFGGFYFNEETEVEDARLYGSDARAYADILAGGGITDVETGLGVPAGTFWAEGNGTQFLVDQSDTQWQLFTQIDFAVTDRLTLTGGVSYFAADKEVDFTDVTRTNPFSDLDFVEIGFGSLFEAVTTLPPTTDNINAFASDPANAAVFGALQEASVTFNDQALAAGGVEVGGVVVDPVTGLPLANPFLEFYPDLQPLGALTPFPNSVEDGKTNDSATPYTLRASYDATDRSNIYISYATGFKASSWNLTPDTRPFPSDVAALAASGELAADGANGAGAVTNTAISLGQYSGTRFAEPETTKTLEIGLKTRFSWGSLNLAAFDQTVEDFQSSIFQGTGFVLSNAGEQSAQGVEFDALIAPPTIPGLTLTLSGLFLDSEYESFENAPVVFGSDIDLADGTADGVGDLTGQTPAGQAEFSGSFAIDYRRDFLDMGEAFIRADYQYESEVQVVDNISEDILSREVGTLNASLGINFDNGFEALIWGRNLNEDEYFTSGFPTTLQAGSVSAYPNQPRTYGVTVRKRF